MSVLIMQACKQMLSALIGLECYCIMFCLKVCSLKYLAKRCDSVTVNSDEENKCTFLFIPSVTTGCYSPSHSPDSPASSPARKASLFVPCPAWIGLYQVIPQVGNPSGGCWWPESHSRDGSAPPRGGWRCSCRGRAASGAVGALSWSRGTAGRPGRPGTGPAGGTCQGGREQKGREGRSCSTWQSKEVCQMTFLLLSQTILYLCPAVVEAPLMSQILFSYCLLSSSPAALVCLITFSSLFLACPPLCWCIQTSSSAQFLFPLFLMRAGRKHMQENGIPSYCNSNSQHGHSAQCRKPTVHLPPTIYVSSEKLLSSLPFQAAGVHAMVQRRREGWSGDRPVSGC